MSALFTADYEEVAPLLEKALGNERARDDPVAAVLGAAAEGVAKAAKLLAGQYTLGGDECSVSRSAASRPRLSSGLLQHCTIQMPKADLATVFLERCSCFCGGCGHLCSGDATELAVLWLLSKT